VIVEVEGLETLTKHFRNKRNRSLFRKVVPAVFSLLVARGSEMA
jgi:hypothetical protein